MPVFKIMGIKERNSYATAKLTLLRNTMKRAHDAGLR